ncbi:hypothetical protein PSEUBRA_005682 [Kalmanozyma brasiliensis GHG001]|uniref:uncharacterized protein n=1 Tax=Kalmanozyma brasiliensis (strain GHG001) TaxID=1365824 RepID=UPI002867FA65|nr:uncharacterized protein PSEUBRA_005682 [Kalmanozyma brasiliensis GHG001]KAF6767546.1 hypothetical protein PSEUBRA_005682 [Kalmanozyma brasiliensis GHG001]
MSQNQVENLILYTEFVKKFMSVMDTGLLSPEMRRLFYNRSSGPILAASIRAAIHHRARQGVPHHQQAAAVATMLLDKPHL